MFEEGLLEDLTPLRDLVVQGAYLAVECTGFAHSASLAMQEAPRFPETIGRVDGVMNFKRAVEAGREQLESPSRGFLFALDVAIAHHAWRFTPYEMDSASVAAQREIFDIFASYDDLEPSVSAGGQSHLDSLFTYTTRNFKSFVDREVERNLYKLLSGLDHRFGHPC